MEGAGFAFLHFSLGRWGQFFCIFFLVARLIRPKRSLGADASVMSGEHRGLPTRSETTPPPVSAEAGVAQTITGVELQRLLWERGVAIPDPHIRHSAAY